MGRVERRSLTCWGCRDRGPPRRVSARQRRVGAEGGGSSRIARAGHENERADDPRGEDQQAQGRALRLLEPRRGLAAPAAAAGRRRRRCERIHRLRSPLDPRA